MICNFVIYLQHVTTDPLQAFTTSNISFFFLCIMAVSRCAGIGTTSGCPKEGSLRPIS